MKLTGTSIILRHPIEMDVPTIYKWENDVSNWLVSNTETPYTEKEIADFVAAGQDFFRDGQMRWMIESQQKELVGCIDLFDFDQKNRRAGIGVLIDPMFRGKGLGLEALKLTVAAAFNELELHVLYAEVLEENKASQLLFERTGFDLIGVKRDWLWDGAQYHDQRLYQMLNKE